MLTASMVKLSSLTDEPEALNNDISHRVIAVLKDERLGSCESLEELDDVDFSKIAWVRFTVSTGAFLVATQNQSRVEVVLQQNAPGVKVKIEAPDHTHEEVYFRDLEASLDSGVPWWAFLYRSKFTYWLTETFLGFAWYLLYLAMYYWVDPTWSLVALLAAIVVTGLTMTGNSPWPVPAFEILKPDASSTGTRSLFRWLSSISVAVGLAVGVAPLG